MNGNPPSHFSAGPPGLQGFRGEAGLPGAKGNFLFPLAVTAALAEVLFWHFSEQQMWSDHVRF